MRVVRAMAPLRLLAAALLATLALAMVPSAQGHLIEQGRPCGDEVFYTSTPWVLAWAQDPIDEDNLDNDHRFNSVGRSDPPCIEWHIPCVSPGTWCPV